MADNVTAPLYSPKPKKKKSRKRLIVWISVFLVIAIGASAFFLNARKMRPAMASTYTIARAEYRDIKVSLSGTGTLEPADKYTVTTLNSGDILEADFEEGDVVKKDTVLYKIDSSNASTNLENAQIALADSQKNYERKLESLKDLSVRAEDSGTIISIGVKVGDKVQSGQTVANIRNSSIMSLEIPFGAEEAKNFTVGQVASVTLDGFYDILSGTITKISAVEEALTGGMLVRKVTIDVPNPGAIQSGQLATAVVGNVDSSASGTFTYKTESKVVAKTSGEVQSINFDEGDYVSKGQVVVVLDSTSLRDDVENAKNNIRKSQLSLDNQKKSLDGYTIQSPIGGTVIEKNYKKGDKAESGANLCTIFDLSYLKMTLNIDELDIKKISVGQKVTVTSDSIANRTYNGVVTKVNINGTTSSGNTTYPITIQIDETDGLLPGMNVDAEIVLQSYENILCVPSQAVIRPNRVLVPTTEADKKTNAKPDSKNDTKSNTKNNTQPNARANMQFEAPEGYKYVEVTVGVSDNNYTEIKSGLSEGDLVAIQNRTAGNTMNMMMGPMGGGMMGGGMPGGRMPSGGMPGGGMPGGGQMGGQRGNFQRGGQGGNTQRSGGQSGGGPAGGGGMR